MRPTVARWLTNMFVGSLSLTIPIVSAPMILAQTTPPPPRAAGLLSNALDAGARGNWSEAHSIVQPAGEVAARLVTWQALRDGEGELAAYRGFLDTHAHWPLQITLQSRAESKLEDIAAQDVLNFFADRTPVSDAGFRALIEAYQTTGARESAQSLAREIWATRTLDADFEARLLALFGAELTAYDAERVDMLLWERAHSAVTRILPRLNADQQALARARLGLQTNVGGVNALIDAVPTALQDAPGLAHDRFQWRIRNRIYDTAGDLLMSQSRHPEGLGRPESWGRWRIFLVREAMSDGAYQRAYDLAVEHQIEDGLFFVDLEFLAGFLALTYLNEPADALPHFRALRIRASSPISLGRAGYWEGRTHEAMNDPVTALAAYEFAAEFQSSYYGQLAADRLGLPLDEALVDGPTYPDWQTTSLAGSDLLEAARLLHDAGQWHEARRFVLHLAGQLETEAELGALADLMLAQDEPNFALNIAKIAVTKEIVLPRAYFPLTSLARVELPVPTDLVKAIARRESEFDAAVVSPADARGLMQVLPGTGRMMAERIGMAGFQPAELTRDPDLNARLGAAYLEELRGEFGPSLALVAAGYNAGPGRPRQWIPRLGDPRDPDVDFVTWVESVPFAETRNYIMRVAESLVIYRSRLAGQPMPIEMERLIRGQ